MAQAAMRCEEDTIPKPDGLAGPVPGLEPNRSRTEAGRCPALFVLGSKLVFGLILDVPPGNVAEESRPVRMAGFEAVVEVAEQVEQAVDSLKPELAPVVAEGAADVGHKASFCVQVAH